MGTKHNFFGKITTTGSVAHADPTTGVLIGKIDQGVEGSYMEMYGNQYSDSNRKGSIHFISDTRNSSTGGIKFMTTNGSTWTDRIKMFNNGNLAINTTIDSGYKLDVNGTARITSTLTANTISSNVITANSLSSGGNTNNFVITGSRRSTTYGTSIFLTGINVTDTQAANSDFVKTSHTFTQSSGSFTYTVLNIANTYNQYGSSNGIIRGVYYNPTLTSVLGDHRAIETTSGNVIFNGGNVGIGTVSPSSLFTINSAGTLATGITFDNAGSKGYLFGDGLAMSLRAGSTYGITVSPGSAALYAFNSSGNFLINLQSPTALPHYAFHSDGDTGMGRPTADTLTLFAGGERMRIASTGNVLVGTTTDSGYKLDVNGDVNSSGNYYSNGTQGYTGTVTIQQPTPLPPINIDISGGIITNVY